MTSPSLMRPDATNVRPEAAQRACRRGWIAGWWGPSGCAGGVGRRAAKPTRSPT
ncbi:hypothetical protein A7982_13115 [Minicystis rosea]|nr:hypothetical protein A7982_13115 [Minicystis rosea]